MSRCATLPSLINPLDVGHLDENTVLPARAVEVRNEKSLRVHPAQAGYAR